MSTERKMLNMDIETAGVADRCAAILTLRLGEKVTRVGAVRIALGELQDKLWETAAEAAGVDVGLTDQGERVKGGNDGR